MGSPYLLAHGLGEPVTDATTVVEVAAPGSYHVWVRAKDWVPSHHPGRFEVVVGGRPLPLEFGADGKDWSWEYGGTVYLQVGPLDVALSDLTGFDGRCDAAVLYAARVAGVHRVFKLGGAQAIAAMAYGTASVPKCEKLFGPGNAWVTEAKLQVSGDPDGAAIDMPAGPSEVLVIADDSADPTFVAADLLSQAEHGPDSQVLLLSPSAALLDAVAQEVDRQCATLPRGDTARQALAQSRSIAVASLAQAVEVSNRYAPEHLILQVAAPRALLDGVESAGSIFLGPWTPESVGDYCSGSNHVLPTYGHARSYSGVSVASFVKQISVQELSADGLRAIGPCTVTLAAAEQLEAHRRAVTLRLDALEAGA